MEQILFRETQHMDAGVLLFIVIAVVSSVVVYKFRDMKPSIRAVSVIAMVIVVFTGIILSTLKLDTVYYTKHVAHRFSSVFATDYDMVSLDSVKSASVVTYDPEDYGGWGVKGNETTRVFNTAGNRGILFTFTNGRMLLLGTQQPDTLKAKLQGYYPMTK